MRVQSVPSYALYMCPLIHVQSQHYFEPPLWVKHMLSVKDITIRLKRLPRDYSLLKGTCQTKDHTNECTFIAVIYTTKEAFVQKCYKST